MDILGILAELHGQRDRINQAIEALQSLNGSASSPEAAKTVTKAASPAPGAKPAATKRVVSPAARQRMAAAQQKRWAKKKRAAKATAKKAASVAPATEKPAKKVAKKAAPKKTKGGITAAGRKRLSEALKARWAEKKKAAVKQA